MSPSVSGSVSKRAWMFVHSLAVLAYFWLLDNVSIVAYLEAGHDDTLFVNVAANILNGQWLGPYNNLTLTKGPLRSLSIAADWLLGLPLLVLLGILCAAACLLLTRGLRPFQVEALWPTLRTMRELLWFVTIFRSGDVVHEPMSCLQDDCGSLPPYTRFLGMVHASLFVTGPWVSTQEFPRRSSYAAPPPQSMHADSVANPLERIAQSYRQVMRILLVAYLNVVSMPGQSLAYFSPAHLALLLFRLASLSAAWNAGHGRTVGDA
jgi:hypothetical protein